MPTPMAAQGVVPSLVTFFSSLELLDAMMQDYVEMSEPGRGSGGSVS